MGSDLHQERLEALPLLYERLMQAPLVGLTQGRLPDPLALYIFYFEGAPIAVGSQDDLDVPATLNRSVRLGYRLDTSSSGAVLSDLFPNQIQPPRLSARWISLSDDKTRKLLELYVAEALSLPPCQLDLAELLRITPKVKSDDHTE